MAIIGYKINIPKVTGDVNINCVADIKTHYNIINNLTNCVTNNTASSIAHDAMYSAIIAVNDGYVLQTIVVEMGGNNISSSAVSGNNITIPNVTGNVVITATAIAEAGGEESGGSGSGGSEPSQPSEPSGTIAGMTYGRGINQTTGAITNNPECWATVDPITVEQGATYTLSVDAPWGWIYSFDESDNFVSPLSTGTGTNPQILTVVADTTRVRYGCYDPNKQLTYCTLTKQDNNAYTVTKNLSNCTINNTTTAVTAGASYVATITASVGYSIGSITVTMGGTDITSSVVNGNTVNISNITGNIVITASATTASYTITNNLSNCTNSNTLSSIGANSAYSATITGNSGYTVNSVTVTMGGTNITSSAVSNNAINIGSVTGNIVITASATQSSSGGTGGDLTGTYLFFGDSICAGGGSNGYGYPEAVKAKQPSMTAINYAVSGTCIAKNDSYDVKYPSILSRIQGSTPYADYVVLEGGFNDSWGYRNPIGTFKGGTAPTTSTAIKNYSASLNAYQFADALEKCICEIKLKYWNKKIFYVIPHNVDSAVYANQYYTVAIQVCNKWGAIVIDLRNCGMPSSKDGVYNVDGTHPSKAGYDTYFANPIINVLKANK